MLTHAIVTVGTPPQLQELYLNVGTYSTSVDSLTAQPCQLANRTSGASCRGGFFDYTQSTTYTVIEPAPAFHVSYSGGSEVTGPNAADVFGVGNVRISGVEFGLAQNISSTSGFATGYLALGAYYYEGYYEQPTILDNMLRAGVVESRLFSLFLGSTSKNKLIRINVALYSSLKLRQTTALGLFSSAESTPPSTAGN